MVKQSDHPLQLSRLTLENVRCFGDVDLSFEDVTQVARTKTLIIGPNGHGKTTIMRAIAIGLCPKREANSLVDSLPGPMIRVSKKGKSSNQGRIVLHLKDPKKPGQHFSITTLIYRDESNQEYLEKETEPSPFPWHRLFVCGYGVNRGTERYVPIENYALRPSVQSLFSEEPALYDPEAVLRNFKLAETESTDGGKLYRGVVRHLKSILQLKPSHKIDITSKQIVVHGPWGGMPFHALGDGYRGTSAWLLDFLGRAHQASVPIRDNGPIGGIVLIDEIDEHLHPDWQRKVLQMLHRRFPHIQFIGTTHSPMTIVNCRPQEVVSCRLYNAVAKVQQDLGELAGKTADQILRGEWFGLVETMADDTEKLLSSYRKAVEDGGTEKEVTHWRHELRRRVGHMGVTPLDELALKMAAEFRATYYKEVSPEKRGQLMRQAMDKMKDEMGRNG